MTPPLRLMRSRLVNTRSPLTSSTTGQALAKEALDTRTPVDDKDYRVPFPFTGTINKLTIKLEPVQLPPERPVGTTRKKP